MNVCVCISFCALERKIACPCVRQLFVMCHSCRCPAFFISLLIPSSPPLNRILSAYLNRISSAYLNRISSAYLNRIPSAYLNRISSAYLNRIPSANLNRISSAYLNRISLAYLNRISSAYLNDDDNDESDDDDNNNIRRQASILNYLYRCLSLCLSLSLCYYSLSLLLHL